MELVKLGEQTYCLKNPTNCGIYVEENNDIWLIDSGNDKDTAKKILKITSENNWHIKGIINTHSHSDHCGGNSYLEDKTSCVVLASNVEDYFIKNTELEASFLYGANPPSKLINKSIKAANSKNVQDVVENLPKGLEIVSLKGHSHNMLGIKTPDDVYFLGDGLISSETINKYHVFYVYDVKKYLESLDVIENLSGKFFIPSHSNILTSPKELVEENRNKVMEIANLLLSFLSERHTFDDILKFVFDHYSLHMSNLQYYLVGDSIKAYLTYLIDEEKVETIIEDNYFYFKALN